MDYDLLKDILKKRFIANINRHPNLTWSEVEMYLTNEFLSIIKKMEDTGGEPDCVEINEELYYIDMAKESPSGRRSICYDKEARIKRKKYPPESSVEEMALSLGVDIVDERMYMILQKIEALDTKTSSWIKTDEDIRKLNGALFGDRRFNRAFIFHNTADSYYKDRGFRGFITVR